MPIHRTRELDINHDMGDTVLGNIVKEKDLGITISADMKCQNKGRKERETDM